MTKVVSPSGIKLNEPLILTEGRIEVPGGKVWYGIAGSEKPGIPLLTVHGGPGAPHDYLQPLEALSANRPVIFYDQLGCGNSDRPSDVSLWKVERFVAELESVRKALKLDRFHLLGQSWGTMLAVEYLLRENHPGIVSLVLSAPYLSTGLWMTDQQMLVSQLPDEVKETIRLCEENGDFDSIPYQDAMMVFYKKHLCRMDPWPECLNRTMEKMGAEVYGHMWGPSEFNMNGTLRDADLTERLNLIRVPLLLTCGEFDESTIHTTAFFQSRIRGSEMHVFTGASHSHQIEKPDEYLKVLGSFLERTESKQ